MGVFYCYQTLNFKEKAFQMNSNLEMILKISIRIQDWFYNNVNKEKNLEMQKLSSLPFQMKKTVGSIWIINWFILFTMWKKSNLVS